MVGTVTAKKAIVFLSNRVYPERPADVGPWQEFRRNRSERIWHLMR